MNAKRVCPHCGQDLPQGDRLPGADPEPKKPEQIPLPAALDDPAVRSEFLAFCGHRAQGWPRERWTVLAARRKLAQLATLGKAEALRWLKFTNDNGLKNIQEPFQQRTGGRANYLPPHKTIEQELREAGL